MTSIHWPHPLDSMFEAGKRRRKQYFPESVPGLYALSKTEVADDIDRIEYDMDRNSPSRGGHPRRRAYRATGQTDAQDADGHTSSSKPASKRSRIVDKIMAKSNEVGQLKPTLAELRNSLDSIRGEVAQHHDGIARLERQIRLSEQERKSLEDNFRSRQDEYKQMTQSIDSRRSMFEASLKSSRENISEITKEVNLLKACEEDAARKDAQIRDLQIELDSLNLRQKMQQEAANKPATAAPSAGAVAPGQSVPMETDVPAPKFYNAYFQDLDLLKEKLSQTLSRVVDLERQNMELNSSLKVANDQLQQAKQEKLDVIVDLRVKEKKLQEEESKVERSVQENKKAKMTASRLTKELQLAEERSEAKNRVVEAADQRAVEAERILFEHTRITQVLKCGNATLQEKFNRVFQAHAETLKEKAEITLQFERSTNQVKQLEAKLETLAAGEVDDSSKSEEDRIEKKLRAQIEVLQLKIEQLQEDGDWVEEDVEMKDAAPVEDEDVAAHDADDEEEPEDPEVPAESADAEAEEDSSMDPKVESVEEPAEAADHKFSTEVTETGDEEMSGSSVPSTRSHLREGLPRRRSARGSS